MNHLHVRNVPWQLYMMGIPWDGGQMDEHISVRPIELLGRGIETIEIIRAMNCINLGDSHDVLLRVANNTWGLYKVSI